MIFRRHRNVPLSPPQVLILLPPVPRGKRDMLEIAELKESAEALMRGPASERLVPWTHQILSTFVPVLSVSEKSHAEELEKNAEGHYGIFAIAIALGASFATLEQERGWQRPSTIDARIWSAIAWTRGESYLFHYWMHLGYWLARTERQGGLEMALAAVGAPVKRSSGHLRGER